MSEIAKIINDSKKKLFVGLAGPGTGKTTAFQSITDSPEFKGKKILILSFINRLVDGLSDAFKSYDNVTVLTLHAYAKKELARIIKSSLDLDKELDNLISEDYSFLQGKEISYSDKFYENDLASDERNFYTERSSYYKHINDLYSFNSIVDAVILHFEEKVSQIPEYDLVLVDEFQDFNKLEWRFIELLSKKNKVVLVGDDDQSLYVNFRNANPNQIRLLYGHADTEKLPSFDYCYRCTRVIVNAVNKLIENAKKKGYFSDRQNDKKFLYPDREMKDSVSDNHQKIVFIPSLPIGDLLYYNLAKYIKEDIGGETGKEILILVPTHLKGLKQSIFSGLLKWGLVVVEYEQFSDESKNKVKHKDLVDMFEALVKRKTDNLALRKILYLYLNSNNIGDLIRANGVNKKIWTSLDEKTKTKLAADLKIYKKAKSGKTFLKDDELKRFGRIFNLKRVASKLINGFGYVKKNAISVEVSTVMSSKGLSADFVYYLGIDSVIDRVTGKTTDHNLREFLVGITRAKEKLTLTSFEESKPLILEYLESGDIKTISVS